MDNTASKIQLAYFPKFIYAIGGAAIKHSHLAGSVESGGMNTDVAESFFNLPLKDPRKSQQDTLVQALLQVLAT